MTKKWLWALAVPAAAGVGAIILASKPTQAADHLDGPRSSADPAADITDVYAFNSPATAGHTVLVMNVFPKATTTSKFSDKVTYNFRIRPISPTGFDPNTVLDVTCQTTAGGTSMACTAPGSLTKTVTVGQVGACASTDDICVFAGLRSDPFFFDLAAFNASVTSNSPKFTNPGTNFFNGFNVLSLVVEVNATKAFSPGALPLFAVSAETKRAP